jgi:hypothetical protein
MTERVAAAMFGIASTGATITGLTITHEAFASVKAECGVGSEHLITLRDGVYYFGSIKVTTVKEITNGLTPHYVVDWVMQ